MVADCVHHGSAHRASHASSGTYTGVFIAGEKLGFALGAALSGLILGFSGLVATTAGEVAQPSSALLGIRLSVSLVPVALNVLAMLLLLRYRPFERRMLALTTARASEAVEAKSA
jgi:Na+/melibiose symporter-like transporter